MNARRPFGLGNIAFHDVRFRPPFQWFGPIVHLGRHRAIVNESIVSGRSTQIPNRRSSRVFPVHQSMSDTRQTWRGGGFGRSTAVKILSSRDKFETHERAIAAARLSAVARRSRDEACAFHSPNTGALWSGGDEPSRLFWIPKELSSEQSAD